MEAGGQGSKHALPLAGLGRRCQVLRSLAAALLAATGAPRPGCHATTSHPLQSYCFWRKGSRGLPSAYTMKPISLQHTHTHTHSSGGQGSSGGGPVGARWPRRHPLQKWWAGARRMLAAFVIPQP